MAPAHTRRRFLAASSAAVTAVMAGCSSNGDGGTPTPPPADTAPADVLPEPPDGWERTNSREVGAGVGAAAGRTATYTPDGQAGYAIAVYRFESVDRTEDIASQVEESGSFYSFQYVVQRGNFLIAGLHEDGTEAKLLDLMGQCKGLTASYIRTHTLLESARTASQN